MRSRSTCGSTDRAGEPLAADEPAAPEAAPVDEFGARWDSEAAVVRETRLVAAAVWRARSELILSLDERFGEPVDAYVNGSQVWVREDGPGGVALEWRLHPVTRYRRPDGVDTYEVFSRTALALATGDSPPPAPLSLLWDGLEVFAAYDDEIEPTPLVAAATSSLGLEPDAAGLVDHESIADEWERTSGGISVVDRLFEQLRSEPSSAVRPPHTLG
jgi:hypothetical protein